MTLSRSLTREQRSGQFPPRSSRAAAPRTTQLKHRSPRQLQPISPVGYSGRKPVKPPVVKLSVVTSAPPWEQGLNWWKHATTGLAILSCAAVLGLYSWTVYTQQRWIKQYEALEQMKRNERQYLLTQESIQNSLRETASRSDMVPLVPERMIEVPIADPLPATPTPTPLLAPPSEGFYPVGY